MRFQLDGQAALQQAPKALQHLVFEALDINLYSIRYRDLPRW